MHQFIGVDIDDLSRGHGEWRNMQDIIRRTFRTVFEHMSQQQDHINQLSETVSNLRQQLMMRPSTKEVTQLVESKVCMLEEKHTKDDGGISTLRAEVVDLRSSLERRATVRYVEEALRRKVNKSDIQLLSSRQSAYQNDPPIPVPTFSDLMQVSDELKAKIERSEIRNTEALEKINSFLTKEDLAKVRDELELQLHNKVDKSVMEKDLRRIEDVLAGHEREIVSSSLRTSSLSQGVNIPQFNHITQQRNLGVSKLMANVSTKEVPNGDDRMQQLLNASRVEAKRQDEASRIESLESQMGAMQLSLAKIENEKDALDLSLRSVSSSVDQQSHNLQLASSRLSDIANIELSIEAMGEQIQECRGQLGEPFSVPVSSMLTHLEDRVNDLDQVLNAQIVQNNNQIADRHRFGFENRIPQSNQIETLNTRINGIENELSARMVLLETEISTLGERLDSMVSDCKEIKRCGFYSKDQNQKRDLPSRIYALEKHCKMSGSCSIKSVQDMLNVVRTVRNVVAKLEKQVENEGERKNSIESKSLTGSNLELIQDLQNSILERIGACEVVEQVHQVRIDALEDNIHRFEHRQLKINDASNRHLKALLSAATSKPSEFVLSNDKWRKSNAPKEDDGLDVMDDEHERCAQSYSAQIQSPPSAVKNEVSSSHNPPGHSSRHHYHHHHNKKIQRHHEGSQSEYEISEDSYCSGDSPMCNRSNHIYYYGDSDSDNEGGIREEKYDEFNTRRNISSPSTASEGHALPVSPDRHHHLLRQFRMVLPDRSKSRSITVPLIHPAGEIPATKAELMGGGDEARRNSRVSKFQRGGFQSSRPKKKGTHNHHRHSERKGYNRKRDNNQH